MITSTIAQRVLKVVENPNRSILVSIGQPQLYPDSVDEWMCQYCIEGIEDAGPHIVHGADSLQVLLLAVEDVRRKLDESGLLLVWQNDEPNNLCIPRMVPYLFGGAFARDIEQYIDDRIEALGKTLTQG